MKSTFLIKNNLQNIKKNKINLKEVKKFYFTLIHFFQFLLSILKIKYNIFLNKSSIFLIAKEFDYS
jgi:hypothetical protein